MAHPGRKPVDALAARRKPSGQDAAWAAIRELAAAGTALTVAAIHGRCAGTHRDTVKSYLARLAAAGILRQTVAATKGGAIPAQWELDPEAEHGAETPRVTRDGKIVTMGAGRAAMWRTIKILGEFTLRDLVVIGSTEEVAINAIDAKFYLGWLARAGYVAVVERPADNRIPTRYRLKNSRNTGPKPPQVQRSHQLYDPNLRKVTWRGEGETL